jgi:dTMP kinase
MFVVIEGIDGAGCQTQAKLLARNLKKAGKTVSLIKYPNYDNPVGAIIRRYLYDKQKLSAEEQFLVYSLQFITDGRIIDQKRQKGVLVADRYFTTTLCYQVLEGVNEEKALSFARDFNIRKPDLVIFLNVRPEVAIKWKQKEKKIKNFREKDIEFMKKTYRRYLEMTARGVWTKWIKVDGEKSIEEVGREIVKLL